MEFNELFDDVAVDLSPESMEANEALIKRTGLDIHHNRIFLTGKYLVVSKDDGPYILSPAVFHDRWKFFEPELANRMKLRTIVRR